MDLNFLSGLLLTAVALSILIFLIKETVGDRLAGHRKVRPYLADLFARLPGREAKPVTDDLIGSIGEVIAHSGDSARPMRVRLGLELWSAQLDSTEETPLPVGTAVKVTAVDGLVLVVVAGTDLSGSPDA